MPIAQNAVLTKDIKIVSLCCYQTLCFLWSVTIFILYDIHLVLCYIDCCN
jgi:hypothetical protein